MAQSSHTLVCVANRGARGPWRKARVCEVHDSAAKATWGTGAEADERAILHRGSPDGDQKRAIKEGDPTRDPTPGTALSLQCARCLQGARKGGARMQDRTDPGGRQPRCLWCIRRTAAAGQ
jgi:hypothetical protein